MSKYIGTRWLRMVSIQVSWFVLVGLFSSAGCRNRLTANKQLTRWVVPSDYISASSLLELTNTFTSLDWATPSFHFVEAGSNRFVFVQLMAHNGLSRFECMAYEQIDPDFWHLRATFWFHSCRSSTLDFRQRGSTVDIQNSGETLFSIHSTTEKERREAK